MKNLILACVAFLSITIVSCGSSEDDCTAENLQQLSSDFSAAAVAFATDPSSENCNEYKRTLELYVNIIKNCDQIQNEEIEEINELIENLDC